MVDVSAQEPLIYEVSQLWEHIFKETFQKYNHLLTQLIHSHDVIAALSLWEEYLTRVQGFLSGSMPNNYDNLSEHRNQCDIHCKLLSEQNFLSTIRQESGQDESVTERFNALMNLHNEMLAKISERHKMVRDRLSAWDRYRLDHSGLLAWFKEIQKERNNVRVQFITVNQFDTVLNKIETLLKKLSDGDKLVESLREQHKKLLPTDEAATVPACTEYMYNEAHMANLRASLESWRKYIQTMQERYKEQSKVSAQITADFEKIGKTLSTAFHEGPTSPPVTRDKLNSVQDLKNDLSYTRFKLTTLSEITERLGDCLTPHDMKILRQRNSLLLRQYDEFEHQLILLSFKLSERHKLHDLWEKRLQKFLQWAEETEVKVQTYDVMILNEPEEVVKRLQYEYQAEINRKQRDFEWLQKKGQELIQDAEDEDKAESQQTLDKVNEKWSRLAGDSKKKIDKLVELIQTMNTLLKRITDLQTWLTGIESQSSETFVIEEPTQRCVDNILADHERLEVTIEAESDNINGVLDLCANFLYDCNTWRADLDTDTLKSAMEELKRRWKAMRVRSTERKKKITMAWKLLQDLNNVRCEHEQWLTRTEEYMSELQKKLQGTLRKELKRITERAKSIAQDIEAHQEILKFVEWLFEHLAKSGLEVENFRSLSETMRNFLDRWLALETKIKDIISNLKRREKTYHDFMSAHSAAVVGLTKVDVHLTEVQHLATSDQASSSQSRRQQLSEVEEELGNQNVTLQKADELALRVMEESNSEDVSVVQEMVDEYQLLWTDIRVRAEGLRTELGTQERSEVDEAVQVETLRFEQDTAVQVDTLPRLVRTISYGTYLTELEVALNECSNALNALEAVVTPDPVPDPGLDETAKTIVRILLIHHAVFLYSYGVHI